MVFPKSKNISITSEATRDEMVEFIHQKVDDARLLGGSLSDEMRLSLATALLNKASEM